MSRTKHEPRIGDTAAVERRIRASGESLGAYLRRADINPGLWWRWRHKESTPRAKTWQTKVIATLRQLEQPRP